MSPKQCDREGLGVSRVFREPVVYLGDFGMEFWRLNGKGSQDADYEVEIRCDSPLFLVQHSNGGAVTSVGRVEPFHQAMVGKREEVGLPGTSRPDKRM